MKKDLTAESTETLKFLELFKYPFEIFIVWEILNGNFVLYGISNTL